MANLTDILDIYETLKSASVEFADTTLPEKFAKYGLVQASIPLEKNWSIDPINKDIIGDEITNKQIYLAGLFAYRFYALRNHDELTQKAINFKTIAFSVTGLTERAKECMRIVWWCDNEINRTLDVLGVPVSGYATEMKGEE